MPLKRRELNQSRGDIPSVHRSISIKFRTMKSFVVLLVLGLGAVVLAAPAPQQQQQQQPGNIFTNFLGSIPTGPLPNLFAAPNNNNNNNNHQGGSGGGNGGSNQMDQTQNPNPFNALAQALNPNNAIQMFQSLFQG